MDEFQQFFDVENTGIKNINQIVVFVWRTFYDKLVEEEITVLEEGTYLWKTTFMYRVLFYLLHCISEVIYGPCGFPSIPSFTSCTS